MVRQRLACDGEVVGKWLRKGDVIENSRKAREHT